MNTFQATPNERLLDMCQRLAQAYVNARDDRDAGIRTAVALGIPRVEVANAFGLSKARVDQVARGTLKVA